eukprot:TRINITY_DN32548_c0_g2_i1.p1 TRINITY_DN32548_c0_g2~~TRINITY_DN32548_c0_g2_i1.p1  ORF type:complete len:736 (+),score=146.29 TRINITY_DN32548_c0_g2_i1:100-2208(+)
MAQSWNQVPTQAYLGNSSGSYAPTQPAMTQVSPGTTIRHPQNSFKSQYWDSQYDASFVKPVGSQAAEAQARLQQEQRRPAPKAAKQNKGDDCCAWVEDNWAKLLLLLVTVIVFVLAVYALITGFSTLSSQAFNVYSKFAWEQWFPSFFVIMVMLMLLTAVALLIVLFAIGISFKETRSLVRAFYIASGVLGIIMLAVALFCWIYSERARPYVIRAGNLLCQDPAVWRCNAQIPNTQRLLSDSLNVSGMDLIEERLLQGVEAAPEPEDSSSWAARAALSVASSFGLSAEGSTSPARRLNPAAASLAFVKSLDKTIDPATNEPVGCATIIDVCQPPAGFSLKTACVCSGNWDYTITTTLPPGVQQASSAPETPTAAVQVVTQAPAAAVAEAPAPATLETPPPSAVGGDAASAQAVATAAASEVPAATPAAATPAAASIPTVPPSVVEGGRRLRQDEDFGGSRAEPRQLQSNLGPWAGAMGAFCGEWGGGVSGEWCFVQALQSCHPELRSDYTSTRGYSMTRSTAPCSGDVESRSQMVLDGSAQMGDPLKLTCLLGLALLSLAGAGFLLSQRPSGQRKSKYNALRDTAPREAMMNGGAQSDDEEEHATYASEPSESRTPLRADFTQQRFQEAQAKAVAKFTQQTPEPLRLQIYAHYKQATMGDVQGDPPGFFQKKEREKYDAWVQLKGMSFEQAVDRYCSLVDRI